MKNFISKSLFFVIFTCSCINSQVYQNWVARYDGYSLNDQAYAIVMDGSDNSYVTGISAGSDHTIIEIATLKYCENGKLQWQNRVHYDYGYSDDESRAINLDQQNNILVGGQSYYRSYICSPYTLALMDKHDNSTGNVTVHTIDGQCGPLGQTLAFVKKIAADANNNIYIAISTDEYTPLGNQQNKLTKKDPNGNLQWSVTYGSDVPYNIITDLLIDNAGYIYLTGSTGINSKGDCQFTTIKFNPLNGNQIWNSSYIGSANYGYNAGGALCIDNNGNIYVTGESLEYIVPPSGDGTITSPQSTFTTVKYNPNGTLLWASKYFGTGNPYRGAFGNSVLYNSDGYIYVTGNALNSTDNRNYDYVTIKYNTSGTQVWVQTYDFNQGDDKSIKIKSDNSGNIYISGYSNSNPNGNINYWQDYDYATIKYNSDGTQLWVIRYDGGSYDKITDMAVDGFHNIVTVTGTSYQSTSSNNYLTIRYSENWIVPECVNESPNNPVSNYINSIYKLNDSSVILCGNQGNVWRTINKGKSWINLPIITKLDLYDILFYKDKIFCVGDSGTIFISTDMGNSWVNKSLQTNKNIKSIRNIRNGSIICAGSNGLLYKTTNYGNSWVNFSLDTSFYINSVYFTDASKGIIILNNGLIYKTINSGLNWLYISSGTTNDLNKVNFYDTINGLIVGKLGIILKTTNGGNAWVKQDIPFMNDLNDIYYVSKDTIYISGNEGTMLVSVNGGNNWKKQTTGIISNLKSVSFWDNGHGISVGNDGKIILTSLDEITDNASAYSFSGINSVENIEPNSFKLMQNYPNPFNPKTKISFVIPVDGKVSLRIYNVLGQSICYLMNEFKSIGQYNINFDGSRYASGIYFYQLVVSDKNNNIRFSQVKKMLLIK